MCVSNEQSCTSEKRHNRSRKDQSLPSPPPASVPDSWAGPPDTRGPSATIRRHPLRGRPQRPDYEIGTWHVNNTLHLWPPVPRGRKPSGGRRGRGWEAPSPPPLDGSYCATCLLATSTSSPILFWRLLLLFQPLTPSPPITQPSPRMVLYHSTPGWTPISTLHHSRLYFQSLDIRYGKGPHISFLITLPKVSAVSLPCNISTLLS